MLQSMNMYNACDYGGVNRVESLGFDKEKTFYEILAIATENKCSIIIKDGNGKWYLKAQNVADYDSLKEKIEENVGKSPASRKCWLLKFE